MNNLNLWATQGLWLESLAPQSVGQTSVDGELIVEPWDKGEDLIVQVHTGAITSGAASTLKLYGLVRGTTATFQQLYANRRWLTETVPDEGDTDPDVNVNPHFLGTAIQFAAADLAAGGAAQSVIMGTIPLRCLARYRYSKLRWTYAQTVAAKTVLIAMSHIIVKREGRTPTAQVDKLFSLCHNVTAA